MAAPRKIAIVTGSRADYGLLRALLGILRDDPGTQLKLIVSGAHLLGSFGSTVAEIERDGFTITAKVAIDLPDDSPVTIARATGSATAGFAEALAGLSPDAVVLIGDRYEMLAAGTAALLLNIPSVHIHGGEVTLGAFDDAIRHALTKMSLLHFVAAEEYRLRVIQMGEDPARVFTVGAPGLDQFDQVKRLTRQEIEKRLELEPGQKFLLVTLHPSTTMPANDIPMAEALLSALHEMRDHALVFTGVNSDPGHESIDARIRAFVDSHGGRAHIFVSLGSETYINALRFADAIVGNSSSGIVEAPAAGVPTVNIGDRQRGRLFAKSVLACSSEPTSILSALRTATSKEFAQTINDVEPPYGRAGASAKIARILLATDLAPLLPKRFYDLPWPPGLAPYTAKS